MVRALRYLTLAEVLELHRRLLAQSGGTDGLHDLAALESAVAQPRATFDGADLYPSLAAKGVALAFSLVLNHPFRDGNKRVGHAALETFLVLNGYELVAPVEDAEALWLRLAAGAASREELLAWVGRRLVPLT